MTTRTQKCPRCQRDTEADDVVTDGEDWHHAYFTCSGGHEFTVQWSSEPMGVDEFMRRKGLAEGGD